jgi:hypothetical protein
MQTVSATMARLLNAKGVILAKEFSNGECNKIAVTSFSKPEDGGFVVTRFFIGFAVISHK